MLAQRLNQIEGGMWREPSFGMLDTEQQWLYLLLLDNGTNDAGVVALTPRRWSRLVQGVTEELVLRKLAELEERGWVLVDPQTEEVFLKRVAGQVFERPGGPAILDAALANVHSEHIRGLIQERIKSGGRR